VKRPSALPPLCATGSTSSPDAERKTEGAPPAVSARIDHRRLFWHIRRTSVADIA
jgi:hypothetical protein